MRAAYYGEIGPARAVLKTGTQPTPAPSAGEVLVRIKVSGVNPSDVKVRSGSGRKSEFPLVIPHSDGAGMVEAVGEGVDPTRIGERVWIWNGQYGRAFGTAAEFIALPAAQAVPLPNEASFDAGACLGIPWLTAWRAVHYGPVATPGETVLVAGGAGSVGHYAIQLAKRAGFRVITTISSEEKAQIARSAGADATVNYKADDLEVAVGAFTDRRGVDRIIEVDLAANAPRYTQLLRRDGLAIVYGSGHWSPSLPLFDWLRHGVELALFSVYELPTDVRTQAIKESQTILRDPGFRHLVAARYPLQQIADAHESVESGKMIGNILVDVE